ncbi:MAG TPA: helix-turn-helix transcriptional regulator [Aggregatilineales bacterium]|nr:helix-turn-helix transcriptional regulator [Aggregatilineales bacterium]
MDVGKAITRLRVQSGLTKEQLAARAGVSQSSLHYIETGVNSPSVRTLSKIAKALGVSIAELLANEGDETAERGHAAAGA